MKEERTPLFIGSKKLGLSILRETLARGFIWKALVICDDRYDERSCLDGFQQLAEANGLELHLVSKQSEAKRLIASINPSIVLVCGWYWIFDKETLSIPADGIWGIHASLLPKYRGGSPLVWAIINGDSKIGASLFKMSAGMDDGPIAYQFSVKFGQDQHISDALGLIEAAICKNIYDAFNDVIDKNTLPYEQVHECATYCGMRESSDGLIDWSWRASTIHNFVRAQSPPYPCAFTFLDGKKVRIAETANCDQMWLGTPGQVLSRDKHRVLVSCGSNTAIFIIRMLDEDGDFIQAGGYVKTIKQRFERP